MRYQEWSGPETESGMVVAGARGKRRGRYLIGRVAVLQDGKCSGDGWRGWLHSSVPAPNTTELHT